jgi:hypothetical protein
MSQPPLGLTAAPYRSRPGDHRESNSTVPHRLGDCIQAPFRADQALAAAQRTGA